MSSQKGNISRKRPPKHKNSHAFKNDLHDTSDRTKNINNLRISNVCHRCKDCIEWKIKYKKYKALTVPAKCVKCAEKKVVYAYHIVCTDCAVANKICAKCSKTKEVVAEPEKSMSEQQKEENMLKEGLKHMRLREKRAFLRQLEKGDVNEEKSGEIDNNKDCTVNDDDVHVELDSDDYCSDSEE